MNVNIGEYYEAKLRQFIAKGVASNKTEALRMAITAYERQLADEEESMVVAKLEGEKASGMHKGKGIPLGKMLKKYGIDESKL